MFTSARIATLTVVLAASFLVSEAGAVTTIYSANFEDLNAGATIVGQGNPAWQSFPANDATTASGATVQNGIGVGGSKALQINTDPLTATAFFYQDLGGVPLAGQIVTLQYSFDLNPPLTSTSTLRSSFSVGLYNAAGARITGVGLNTTGNLTYVNAAGTSTTYTLPTPVTSAQGFHTFVLTINFGQATPTGTISFDGSTLPITAGVVAANGTTVSDVDLVATPSGYDVGVFDNVSLVANAVPEPGTFALLGAGALALAGFARRRKG